ncbi:Uncharacterized protein QTN25_006725 [Entamoeba marina]
MKPTQKVAFLSQLNQLNLRFQKALSVNIPTTSPCFPSLVMTNLEKVKNDISNLSFEPFQHNDKNSFDTLFQFWDYLLYIFNHGQYTPTLDLLLETLHKCVIFNGFYDIMKLYKNNPKPEFKSICSGYVKICSETYEAIYSLFEELEIAIITKQTYCDLTLEMDTSTFQKLSSTIIPKVSDNLQNVLAQLLSALTVSLPNLSHFINSITGAEVNPKNTIHCYNIHNNSSTFQTQMKEFKQPTPFLLLYPNYFMFITYFIPHWISSLKSYNVSPNRIVRSGEYFYYQKWIFQEMGSHLRMTCFPKHSTAIVNMFQTFISLNDKSVINELIIVMGKNTNIFDLKSLNRMSCIIDTVIRYLVEKESTKKDIFDETFKVYDFIQLFELTITSEHVESLLKLLGLVYDILPYFVRTSREYLLLEYFLHKKFNYFFTHWSDMVRNVFFHIILYRALFSKQTHLLKNKFTKYELNEYKIRQTVVYDPIQQDKQVYNAISTRMSMLRQIISNFPSKKKIDELRLINSMNEFELAQKKYFIWEAKKNDSIMDVPKVICSYETNTE